MEGTFAKILLRFEQRALIEISCRTPLRIRYTRFPLNFMVRKEAARMISIPESEMTTSLARFWVNIQTDF